MSVDEAGCSAEDEDCAGNDGPDAVSPIEIVPWLPLGADDELTGEIERQLGIFVLAAQTGDRDARDHVYAMLAPKLRRWTGREWRLVRGFDGLIEHTDIEHEGYLVLVDLIERWPGEAGFGAYVFSRFPFRLRESARRLAGMPVRRTTRRDTDLESGWQPGPVVLTPALEARLSWELADQTSAADEALAHLESIANGLGDPDGLVLLWKVRDRQPMTVIADRLGVTRRSAHRRWQRIRLELRASLR